MNNGKDYNYDRGAWAMKHPPPSTEINYFFTWLFACAFYVKLQLPPPKCTLMLVALHGHH